MRLCVIYDCLFPYTVGGAERWYRHLAGELAAAGHEVTYLTRRQWPEDRPPKIDGVDVVAVSAGGPLYTPGGRRTISSPLRFALGVFRHLVRNRGSYDAVHGCSFPYFWLPAARAALARRRVTVGVEWIEVWSRGYWIDYLGPVAGRAGHAVQRICARLTPLAFVHSDLHGGRLRELGHRGEAVRLSGLYTGRSGARVPAGEPPLVVFAGRHIAEKRVEIVPAAIAAARRELPDLRGLVLGDGPERKRVLQEIARLGLEDVVEAPGFVETGEVEAALAHAACMLLPSVREGYGMVVIEAAAAGTPSVVVAAPDNAAVELIEEGENGYVAALPEPHEVGRALVRACHGGEELRDRTAAWFERNAERLEASSSVRIVAACYEAAR